MNATATSVLSQQATRLTDALGEIFASEGFALRCFASGGIAMVIYFVFAGLMHRAWGRKTSNRNIYEWALNGDIGLALVSLAFGSPVLQIFGVAHEKWGSASGLLMYTDIAEHGIPYWLLSIPLYLLLWDLTFYVLHLVLHMEPIYSMSHKWHHRFSPPVAWSGIAIDPVETIFSGLAPYLVPLYILPFHLPTVYVVNILLVGWATMLHSACPWQGNWLMQNPITHNLHHSKGKLNSNYGAIFKIWDRIFGTLNDAVPVWMQEEQKARLAAVTKKTEAVDEGATDPTPTPVSVASTAASSSSSSSSTASPARPAPKQRAAASSASRGAKRAVSRSRA